MLAKLGIVKLKPNAAVNVEHALAMFDDIVERWATELKFIKDGCAARAHLMCAYFLDRNIIPQKAWVLRQKGKGLKGKLYGKPFNWKYHVAPVIQIKDQQEARYHEAHHHVIDPAMFDGPVSIETWAKKIKAKGTEEVEIAPHNSILIQDPSGNFSITNVESKKLLVREAERNLNTFFWEAQQEKPRRVYKSKMRVQFNERVGAHIIDKPRKIYTSKVRC